MAAAEAAISDLSNELPGFDKSTEEAPAGPVLESSDDSFNDAGSQEEVLDSEVLSDVLEEATKPPRKPREPVDATLMKAEEVMKRLLMKHMKRYHSGA